MSNDYYKKIFKEWLSEFKNKFNSQNNNSSEFKFYILNKDFFSLPQKRGNLNEEMINNENIDYKNKRFFLLDEKTWNKI